MRVAARVLHASRWQALALASTTVGQVVVTSILARQLEPADFGVMAIGLALIELVLVVGEFGAGAAIARHASPTRGFVLGHLRRVLLRGTGVVLIGVVLGMLWTRRTGDSSIAAATVGLALGGVALNLATTLQAVAESRLDFRRVALADLAAFWVGSAVVSIPLAFLGAGVWSLVAGYAAQSLVRAAAHIGAVAALDDGAGKPEIHRDVAGFGLRLTVARLLNAGVNQADRIALSFASTVAGVGQYSRGALLSSQLSVGFGGVYDRVLYPLLAKVHRESATALPTQFLRAVWMAVLALTPVAVLFSLESTRLIRLLLGEGWETAAQVLLVSSLAVPGAAVVRVCDTLARAVGRPGRSVRNKGLHLLALAASLALAARSEVSTALMVAGAAVLVVPLYARDAVVTAGGTPRDLRLRAGAGAAVLGLIVAIVAGAVIATQHLTGAMPLAVGLVGSGLAAALATISVVYADGLREDGFLRWVLAPFLGQLPAPLLRLIGVP